MNRHTFHSLTFALLVTAAALAQTGAPASNAQASQPVTTSQGSPTPGMTSAPSSPAGPAHSAPSEPAVSEDAPVITINGVCDVSLSGADTANAAAKPTGTTRPGTSRNLAHTGTAKPGATSSKSSSPTASTSAGDCKTQITRSEFEKLLKTAAPTAPPSQRRQIAARFVQFFTAANEGAKLGVDKDPEFPEQLALMRLELLARDAQKKLQAQAADVSEADAKAYYDQNPSAFEEVTLTRIFIPRAPAAAPAGQSQASAPDAEAIAKDARQQLVSGTDPEKIQKSVYDQLKNTTTPPNTKFGAKRRGTLPPAHEQKVFALKPGEVSDPISDSVGYVVYRVDSRQQLPFDQVKDEVRRKLTQQRMEDAQQKMLNASKAEFNDAYFGPETAPPRPPSMGGAPPTLRPPGGTGSGSGNAPPPPSSSSQSQQQSQPTVPKR